ncbi:hypothetical protein [Nocardia camponoti]|uniref:Uncharacterized protein n=1 Tax=Nocardia camponoti TaxID=1616106 RepID=A0A917QUW6_9NOCA|nr:hypothetical protein [Nocardia camponoti]GGK68976.1 hypothetical protein GCM10011591_46370 [Nocardia camponoti]
MAFPATTHDEVVSYAASQVVDDLARVSDMTEMLIEQCRVRARDSAAEESTATPSGPTYTAIVLGVDHTIAPLHGTGLLVSVVVTTELRPIL